MSGTAGRKPAFFCYGAGAIGGLLSARLHQAGFAVAVIARGRTLEALRNGGLLVRENDSELSVRPAVFDSVREAAEAFGSPAAVILTVKAYDVAQAAEEIASVLGESSGVPILCLQNGIGSEEVVARHLGPETVWAGAITLSVERIGPGDIRVLTRRGGLAIARFSGAAGPGGPGAMKAGATGSGGLIPALREAGFTVLLHPRGEDIKWSKALLNLWANASAAVYDRSPSAIVSDPALFHLDWMAFKEALRVMRAARIRVINLPGYPTRLLALLGYLLPEWLFRRFLGAKVAGGRGGKMPSLWIDLESGRRQSEVMNLNGAVAARARQLGLPSEANQTLTAALVKLSSGEVSRDHFARHHPAVLGALKQRAGH